MGHLTYAQAYEHGYHGSGREDTRDDWTGKHTGGKGWQPLPQELYHTTTNAAGVMQHGLKSAQELGHKNGHGLGGTPQWLSMTYSADHAHNMLDALHEYHDHLNGKTSFADLHKAAQNGEGAQKPFHEAMTSTFGREPDAVREARMQGKRIEPGFAAHEEAAAKGWEPHPEFHQNFGQGKDGRTYGSGWTRPASIEEKHDEYGAFSRAREFEGQGKPSILFLSNDRKAFAAKDPKNFAVLKLRPKPGAQGYPMEGEHEWRTGTGHAVDVEGEPIRRKAVRTAAASGPHEVDLDAMDSASSGPTAAHVPPGTTGTDSQGHGVQMTTMDGWAHRDGSHGHEDGPDVGEQPVYTQDHTWLPEGRYWGPNSAQNDQRLFSGDHLRPEVRQDILDRVGGVLGAYDGWEKWTRVYFAGSQAAQWLDQNGQGNGDFDILIGIDFEEFRDRNPQFEEIEDAEIADTLTDELWTKANAKEYYFTLHDGRSVGPFDRTFYCQPPGLGHQGPTSLRRVQRDQRRLGGAPPPGPQELEMRRACRSPTGAMLRRSSPRSRPSGSCPRRSATAWRRTCGRSCTPTAATPSPTAAMVCSICRMLPKNTWTSTRTIRGSSSSSGRTSPRRAPHRGSRRPPGGPR
jgi:hypothetical protein